MWANSLVWGLLTLAPIMDLRAGVLNQFAASRQEAQALEDGSVLLLSTKLPWLFALTDKSVDVDPVTRKVVAAGIASVFHRQFVLEGKAILSAVFAGSFKRCALIWKLLLKELTSSCPQRLLLKLEYCQKFCIRTFNSSPVDTRQLLVSENAASITFALDLSIAVLQGIFIDSVLGSSLCMIYIGPESYQGSDFVHKKRQ